jgi:hypothetical protein
MSLLCKAISLIEAITSFATITRNEVKIAVNKLNSRPRKCLGFKTPYQVFFERTGIDARQLGVVRL